MAVTKRILALILSLCLCLSMIPAAAAEDIEIVDPTEEIEIVEPELIPLVDVEKSTDLDIACTIAANETWYWPFATNDSPSFEYKKITSSYGFRGGEYQRRHYGVDIGVPKNTNVYSIQTGTVNYVHNSNSDSRGRYIVIQHDNGFYSQYFHLQELLVKTGDKVSLDTIIAKSGASGYGSDSYYGAHLHLAINYGGTGNEYSINPCPYGYTKIGSSFNSGYPMENYNDSDGKKYSDSNPRVAYLTTERFSGGETPSSPVQQYLEQCTSEPCNVILTVTTAGNMKNMPCSVSTNPQSETVEALALGHTYSSTKKWINTVGSIWYEVRSANGTRGFIYSGDVSVSETQSTLSLSGTVFPSGHYDALSSFGLRGVFSSNYTITQIVAYVKDSNNNFVMTYDKAWNKTSYNIQSDGLNNAFSFGSLSNGAYYFYVAATDSSGKKVEFNTSFDIGTTTSPPAKPTITTDKSVYNKGDTISISWNAVAGNEYYCINIYRNDSLIYEANLGQTTYYKLTDAQVGSYRILVSANNSAGRGLAERSVSVIERESTLSLTGVNFPSGHYDSLPNFGLRGVFSSNYTITQIVSYVSDTSGNHVLSYDKTWDKTQYDIQNDGLNSAFSFGSLPNGAYYFYVSATDSSGKKVESNTFFDIGTTAPATYTVSYDANGGNNAPGAQTKIHDIPLTLSSAVPDRKGFIFLGWATRPDSAIVLFNPGGVYSKNADIVLYALWTPDTPEIWTAAKEVYLDLSGDKEAAVYYFYSGDTEYGYGLTKEVGDPSIVDSAWGENGEECVRLTGLKPGTTYLWIALVEYNTDMILDEVYCTIIVTDSGAPSISGYCGDDMTWVLDDNGTLRIRGTGEMWNYSEESPGPWCQYNDSINEVIFDDEVESIGAYAFFELENLEWIQFPYSLTRINDRALARCSNLKNYTLPPNLTCLEPYALSGCDSIIEVFVPAKLTDIGYGAFEFCSSLTAIDVSEDNPNYYSLNGALVQKEDGLLHSFPAGISDTVFIPEEIRAIGLSAFSGCKQISKIVFADVTDVGTYAFYSCDSLESIRFCCHAPAFHGDCFLGNWMTVYYPSDDSTWTAEVMQDYNGWITWMPYLPMTIGETLDATLPVYDTLNLCIFNAGIPADGVVWTSSNDVVADVDDNGTVTACKYGKCTIYAVSNGQVATCEVQTLFYDVADPSVYYFKHVYWAAENGITKGYNLEYFDPQGTCTREQMITFLWRMAGKPEPKTTTSKFSDVKKGAYYYKAVLWGVEKGITNGYSSGEYAGKFGVGLPCTREQAMTFLWRFAGKPNPKSTSNKFADVKSSDYYYKAVLWASENKIANGYSSGEYAGKYGVGLPCLREHMVTFLSKYASKFMN